MIYSVYSNESCTLWVLYNLDVFFDFSHSSQIILNSFFLLYTTRFFSLLHIKYKRRIHALTKPHSVLNDEKKESLFSLVDVFNILIGCLNYVVHEKKTKNKNCWPTHDESQSSITL